MPECSATSRSKPTTIGGSVTNSGTACRCMFEPINARFASSCSRNESGRPKRQSSGSRHVDVLDLVDGNHHEVSAMAAMMVSP